MMVCFWQEEAQMMYVEVSGLNKRVRAVDGATLPLGGGSVRGMDRRPGQPLSGQCSANSRLTDSLGKQIV